VSQDSYTDAELAELDLGALLRGGLTEDDGRMKGDVQGIGSVAAAVQLDNAMVSSGQVADAAAGLRGEPPGVPHPAVDHLIRQAPEADRAVLAQWLGMVANLLVLRERSRA
jgi:hypothetical protein